ncbi:MAG: RND transporter [Sphingomonas sp.]|nr:RND transporter [Sphingomonas sp.]|tara:strand:- start:1704 stop:3143 length:1440 start_codon:yes stop_codon:yes gene_type:complete
MTVRKVAPLLPGLLLAACVQGPEYRPAAPADLGVPEGYSVPADSGQAAEITQWWQNFDDPMLADLVERGRDANLDIAQAIARLRQARESLVQSRAGLLPTVSASGGYSRTEGLRGTSVSSDGFSLGADASYQVDLFGGTGSSLAAARADYEAAGYDYASVLISIEAEIARNYVTARLLQAQLDNARRSLTLQDDNLEIAGYRVQAGLVSSLDSEQARSQRAQTAATIPSLEASYNSAVSRIAVLLGLPPGALKAELETPKGIPQGPDMIPVGIPADTLRQRPDVRSAERSLAAATARIGVAQAQLFPALSIGGGIDTSASSLDTLTDIITGQVFANLAQTIFDGGRNRSQVRASEAAAEGAFYAYKQTVLTSLEDVENALAALRSARERERYYADALDAANNVAILSRSQYRTGLTDFTTLNTAEASLLSAGNGLAQARADQATAIIQLYLALGGGWDSSIVPQAPDEPPAPLPTSQER